MNETNVKDAIASLFYVDLYSGLQGLEVDPRQVLRYAILVLQVPLSDHLDDEQKELALTVREAVGYYAEHGSISRDLQARLSVCLINLMRIAPLYLTSTGDITTDMSCLTSDMISHVQRAMRNITVESLANSVDEVELY